MAARNLYLEPPYKSPLLQRDGTVAVGWLSWLNAVARLAKILTADSPFDVPSIPAGGTQAVTMPCRGARPGDFAQASYVPGNVDVALLAQVVNDDEVALTFWNTTAGAIDLAAGTIRVRVEQAQ
jgi:hypothetical protein